MKNRLNKTFCSFIALLLVVLLVIGCGNTSDSEEPQESDVQDEVSDSVNDGTTEDDAIDSTSDDGSNANSQEASDSENEEESGVAVDEHILNYDIYSDDNISVSLVQITEEGVLCSVENKLDEAIYYTNYVFSFDGYNLSDYSGLVYNSVLIAPNSTGNVLTETDYYTNNPSYIYGRASYETEDSSIEEDIVFSYGDENSIPEGSVFESGTTVYEDDNITVEFVAADTAEFGGASFIVVNKSDYLMSYVNTSISFDGVSYSDEAGLVYNSTYIAPKSTGKITTELTEEVAPEIEKISGSGNYYFEEIESDNDFSYTDVEVK